LPLQVGDLGARGLAHRPRVSSDIVMSDGRGDSKAYTVSYLKRLLPGLSIASY
jgi:hypothetical protein